MNSLNTNRICFMHVQSQKIMSHSSVKQGCYINLIIPLTHVSLTFLLIVTKYPVRSNLEGEGLFWLTVWGDVAQDHPWDGWSHDSSQEQSMNRKWGLGDRASRPTPSDPLPPAKLPFLKAPQLSINGATCWRPGVQIWGFGGQAYSNHNNRWQIFPFILCWIYSYLCVCLSFGNMVLLCSLGWLGT